MQGFSTTYKIWGFPVILTALFPWYCRKKPMCPCKSLQTFAMHIYLFKNPTDWFLFRTSCSQKSARPLSCLLNRGRLKVLNDIKMSLMNPLHNLGSISIIQNVHSIASLFHKQETVRASLGGSLFCLDSIRMLIWVWNKTHPYFRPLVKRYFRAQI